MLCGYPPFNGRNSQEINEAILNNDLVFDGNTFSSESPIIPSLEEDWGAISEESKNFIRKLLTKDPVERISAQEAFEDSWLQKLSEDTDAKQLSTKALGSLKGFQVSLTRLLERHIDLIFRHKTGSSS